MGASPAELLDLAFQQALSHVEKSIIMEPQIAARVETICRYIGNRACVRFILACALAKAHRPDLDIRKPYTEIGTPDAFSGRTYDEAFITKFVLDHGLPCNNTTAFLTPAFRNRNTVLTPDLTMVGRPESLYKETLQLLTDVQTEKVSASDLLVEVVRCLLVFRDENRLRMESLIASLKRSEGLVSLSAEAILGLIEQHLSVRGSSRLPVLIVAAAYKTISAQLGEQIAPLQSHNAADIQTDSLGDLEITLIHDEMLLPPMK